VLADEGPFSPLEAAEVGLQVAAALQVIHTAGFVYRDVKPQNILRCSKRLNGIYQYRLIDFGSAVGVGGCLFGGETSSCNLDANPQRTRQRLSELFLSLSQGGDTLSSDKLVECCRAAGLTPKSAQLAAQEMLQKHKSEHADSAPVCVSEHQFLDIYGHLVREQDKGVPAGTLNFMAPEQFLAGDSYEPYEALPYSARSDIYALGVTLFRLLTAKFPIEAPAKHKGRIMTFQQSLQAWTQLHRHSFDQHLPSISSVVPVDFRVSNTAWDQVAALITQAVEKSSHLRQHSATDLHHQFADIISTCGTPLQQPLEQTLQPPLLLPLPLPLPHTLTAVTEAVAAAARTDRLDMSPH